MISNRLSSPRVSILTAILIAAITRAAAAELFINEIYFDPPSNPDHPREYIELRGTPDMSLNNHYLIFIENEDDLNHEGSTGQVEFVFDLGGGALGTNGYLTLRQKDSPFSVAPGATDLINTGVGNGFGSGLESSTIGAVNESSTGVIENSGFTAMIIRDDGGLAPHLGLDLDVGNDGLDSRPDSPQVPIDDWASKWAIVDAIGIFSEFGEAGLGRLYAPINFGPEMEGQALPPSQGGGTFAPRIEPGAKYVGVGYEIEYIARYGDSTGHAAKDWHMSNLTDNSLAGFIDAADGFRQAGGDPHGWPRPDGDEVESNQFIPYGTNMNDTLGAPNYPLNQTVLPWDFNQNGVVDAADYTIWRDTLNQTDPTGDTLAANADGDGTVDQGDYDAWKSHFSESLPIASGAADLNAVPEPATWLMGILAIASGIFEGRSGRTR